MKVGVLLPGPELSVFGGPGSIAVQNWVGGSVARPPRAAEFPSVARWVQPRFSFVRSGREAVRLRRESECFVVVGTCGF